MTSSVLIEMIWYYFVHIEACRNKNSVELTFDFFGVRAQFPLLSMDK